MSLRKAAWRTYARWRRRVLGIPQPGRVNFGDFRRLEPLSRDFGSDRGLPPGRAGGAVDRHYIERFLEQHASDVRGRVLEIGERTYTRRYGGERVTASDVLHVTEGNPQATVVADLTDAPQIPNETFDCIILTQTLQYLFDPRAAVQTLHRILKPHGTLLLTVPGITPVPAGSQWGYTWYWSFTPLAVERLIAESFGKDGVTVTVGGNVLAAVAFLHGLAAEELTAEELDTVDPDYPVNISARAFRAAGG